MWDTTLGWGGRQELHRAGSFSDADSTRCADLDALRSAAAQVAVVGIPLKDRQCMKGTPIAAPSVPEKFFLLWFIVHFLTVKALHLLTLSAHYGPVHTRFQVILLDSNCGSLGVHHPHMEKGARHLAQVAAAALFPVNLDSHISIPSLLRVLFLGIPSSSQP